MQLLRKWFHEQGTLTHLYKTTPWIAAATVILGGKWDKEPGAPRVKMYVAGSLLSGQFREGVLVERF